MVLACGLDLTKGNQLGVIQELLHSKMDMNLAHMACILSIEYLEEPISSKPNAMLRLLKLSRTPLLRPQTTNSPREIRGLGQNNGIFQASQYSCVISSFNLTNCASRTDIYGVLHTCLNLLNTYLVYTNISLYMDLLQ